MCCRAPTGRIGDGRAEVEDGLRSDVSSLGSATPLLMVLKGGTHCDMPYGQVNECDCHTKSPLGNTLSQTSRTPTCVVQIE